MNREAKELKAFLDKIGADPRNLVTRMVFADWLDEHDEPEMADEQRNFDVARYDAEKRLREVADRYAGGDYEGMVKGAVDREYCFGDDDWYGAVNEQFWDDVETMTKARLDDDHRQNASFRCAC